MKVTIDEGSKLTVERGQNNSKALAHSNLSAVWKVVTTSTSTSYQGATYGYMVFRGPNNINFYAPLGDNSENSSFTISSNCLNGTYVLQAVVVNGSMAKGQGAIQSTATQASTYDLNDYTNIGTWPTYLGDYVFKVSNAIDYVQPTLVGADATSGAFTITGDKGSALTTGGTISYTVASNAITAGSFETEYVTMTFDITSSSTGQVTGSRTILLNKSGSDYTFSASINTLSTSDSNLKNTWKTGSKYQLSSISISNGVSEVNYKPNGTYNDTYSNLSGNHDVYYLDQFSFTVSDQ